LDRVTRKLRAQTLKTQLDMCRLVCASLAKEVDSSYMTPEHRAALAQRSYKAHKEGRSLQRAIDALEEQETRTAATEAA